MGSAQKLFDEHCDCGVLDVVSWTAMVTGYSNCGQLDRAWWFFDGSPSKNSVTWNAMIVRHAWAGREDEVRELFDEIPDRNVATWGSTVWGFSQCGLCKEALALFWQIGWDFVEQGGTGQRGVGPCAVARFGARGADVLVCRETRSTHECDTGHGFCRHVWLMWEHRQGQSVIR